MSEVIEMKLRIPYSQPAEFTFGYVSDKHLTATELQEKQKISDRLCCLVNITEIYCKDKHNSMIVNVIKKKDALYIEIPDELVDSCLC